MGFLGFGKKKDVVDLSERYRKQQEAIEAHKEEQVFQTESGMNFLADLSNVAQTPKQALKQKSITSDDYADLSNDLDSGSIEHRRRKLAKRLMLMTDKLEDLSNQIYHLQQRIELLERKTGVGR